MSLSSRPGERQVAPAMYIQWPPPCLPISTVPPKPESEVRSGSSSTWFASGRWK